MENEKKIKFYKGGYLPVEKIEKDIKIHNLLENPPSFKDSNDSSIKSWLKKILDLYKS